MSLQLKDIADKVRHTYIPSPEDDFPYIGLEHVELGSLHISGIGSSLCVRENAPYPPALPPIVVVAMGIEENFEKQNRKNFPQKSDNLF